MGSNDNKLDDLSERIQQAEAKSKPDPVLGSASRVGWDFAGAVIGSGIIGALLDHFFGTSPWCLLGMVMAGFMVGITNAWRSIRQFEKEDNRK